MSPWPRGLELRLEAEREDVRVERVEAGVQRLRRLVARGTIGDSPATSLGVHPKVAGIHGEAPGYRDADAEAVVEPVLVGKEGRDGLVGRRRLGEAEARAPRDTVAEHVLGTGTDRPG